MALEPSRWYAAQGLIFGAFVGSFIASHPWMPECIVGGVLAPIIGYNRSMELRFSIRGLICISFEAYPCPTFAA